MEIAAIPVPEEPTGLNPDLDTRLYWYVAFLCHSLPLRNQVLLMFSCVGCVPGLQ